MPKQGFKNQWIPISQVGKFDDNQGVERDLNDSFLNQVITNTKPNDAPAVIGHPKDNSPAFGWATALRLENGVLEAQFADTDDAFETMVEKGTFKKRSASFYLNPPSLRHVGFLGAMPPAVKGLRDIQFSDGEAVTVEISFSEDTKIMEIEDMDKVAESLWEKLKNKFKTPEENAETGKETTAQFSEADKKDLIAEAVRLATEKAEASFTEKLKERDTQIEALTKTVDASSASGKHAEIVSFVEAIPAEKGKHFLKQAGIVEFMESLAEDDKSDAISFAEGDTTHKFSRLDWFKNYVNAQQSFVEFGEKFGNIVATAEADVQINPGDLDQLRGGMGVEKTDGGAK